MTDDTQDRPGLEERYSRARTSKDLSVGSSELPSRDADVLAAAAWSQSRAGHALLRLHSEWDSAEKPVRLRRPDVERIAQGLPRLEVDGKMTDDVDMTAAWNMAHRWYVHEFGMLLGKLKTLPEVRLLLIERTEAWGWESPRTMSAEVLRWWLDQTCHVCHGTKWQMVDGTNRHSGKPCTECGGSGHSEVPHGQLGIRLANWMDEGVNIARRKIGRALQAYRKDA